MEFIGWAIKRSDTGKYWNKHRGWNNLPTIYEKRGHAINAGKYHSSFKDYDLLRAVKIKNIVIEVEETNEQK